MSSKFKRSIVIALAFSMLLTSLVGCGATSESVNHRSDYSDITGESAYVDESSTVDGWSDEFNSGTDVLGGLIGPSDVYTPPDYNTEEFSDYTENRFMSAAVNPLSTFAADVDTASYSTFRRYINRGSLPSADTLRTEELLNYFRYDYNLPDGNDPFGCTTELIQCPWNEDTLLLLVGLATEPVDTSDMPSQNLVFLIDVSGSMDSNLDLVKRSFLLLCDQLKPDDRVSIVTYASNEEVVIEGATGNDIDLIMEAIETLTAGGSTNGADGINTAYEIAEKYYLDGGNNRIILATDGDLNVGTTSEADLRNLVEERAKSGVYLSVLGFGSDNYKDNKLETLADNGNGNYAYIDSVAEARKALIEDAGGTLLTVAKDVKLQVEFNPAVVKGYRLIGYETRVLNAEDFADDSVDGGEVGAGHRVTVLYEVVPIDSKMDIPGIDLKYQNSNTNSGSFELCTVNVRAKKPSGLVNSSALYEYPVEYVVSDTMSDNMKLASAIAELVMILNNSEFKGTSNYDGIIARLRSIENKDALIEEFERLVRQANRLS